MKVVTVVNNTDSLGFNQLRFSCAANDLQLIVLVGQKDFNTNRIKDELLEDYLSETDDNEIIFFTDGNDAVFVAKEEEILKKFYRTNSDLVFSAELTCWPDITLAQKHPQTSNPYKYLNSGGFIGRAGRIKELIKDDNVDMENFKRSNQFVWMQRYLKNTSKIKLDSNCEIFSTFTPQVEFPQSSDNYTTYFSMIEEWFNTNFVIKESRIFNKLTNTWPCHAHFNGFSKSLLNRYFFDIFLENTSSYEDVQFYYEKT